MLHYEDFKPGDVSVFGGVAVERDAMVDFARRFDPQPFHLDEGAARNTFVGRLIASGWYTAALQMRMICDAWMLDAAGLGSPGVDTLRWLRPVVAGDRLSVRQHIVETKLSRSRPGMGLVLFRFETVNGAGETVMEQTNWVMLAHRGADVGTHEGGAAAPAAPAAPESKPLPVDAPGAWHFDDLVIGREQDLGIQTLSADEITRFARDFDPQPFHLDEAAAKASAFGGLAASGWHTAALWMRSYAVFRAAIVDGAKAAGIAPPRYGSSPGFKNLRWLKPVRPGDSIRYATTLSDKRLSASRPGWGLTFSHNTGHNQHGELVFSFEGSSFVAQAGAPA
jgi:acyl dehydratase